MSWILYAAGAVLITLVNIHYPAIVGPAVGLLMGYLFWVQDQMRLKEAARRKWAADQLHEVRVWNEDHEENWCKASIALGTGVYSNPAAVIAMINQLKGEMVSLGNQLENARRALRI